MLRVRVQLQSFWQSIDAVAKKIILALALAVVVLFVCLFSTNSATAPVSNVSWQNPQPAAPSTPNASSSQLESQLVVHVVGEVLKPGVYQLAANSRVMDAIFAAGGFTESADQASINLARLVNDGEQIMVLARGTQSTGLGSGQPGLVNLNFADSGQLDALPGVGPTLAQRIIDYRKVNGGFTSLGDLSKVAGFGPSLITKLTNLVTF